MLKPPVLSMPNRKGRFVLYSDTSKIATGSALYQHQDGRPRLIAITSKECQKQQKLFHHRVGNVWIGYQYHHILTPVEKGRLYAVVDHLAITHIMKSKMEPATNRIKRLLEVLGSYSFNQYYIKGKDMVFSDYLSRHMGDKSNPHEVIPISFDMRENSLKSCQNKAQGHIHGSD